MPRTGLAVTIVFGFPNEDGHTQQRTCFEMKTTRKGLLAVAIVGTSMIGGGAIGATLLTPTVSSAATASSTPATSSGGGTTVSPPSGTFHSNEDPTHEAGESAAREAQENAGQFPTVP